MIADLGPDAYADSQVLEKRDGGLGVAQRCTEHDDAQRVAWLGDEAQVGGHVVRGRGCPVLPPGDDVDGRRLGPVQLETRGARLGDRGEHKAGDHTELPPARAPQRPEQLRFPVKVAVDDTPVGEDDLGAQQGIPGQPVTSSQEAEPAAEGEAGDPDPGATAGQARRGGIGAAPS